LRKRSDTPRLGATAIAVSLGFAILAGGAQAAEVDPHPVVPHSVTPHVVAPPDATPVESQPTGSPAAGAPATGQATGPEPAKRVGLPAPAPATPSVGDGSGGTGPVGDRCWGGHCDAGVPRAGDGPVERYVRRLMCAGWKFLIDMVRADYYAKVDSWDADRGALSDQLARLIQSEAAHRLTCITFVSE
jgi:hypothetical protein